MERVYVYLYILLTPNDGLFYESESIKVLLALQSVLF